MPRCAAWATSWKANGWLRYGVVALFFLAFHFFASTNYGIRTSYAIPEGIRIWGTWINTLLAILVLVVIFYLIYSDRRGEDAINVAMRDALTARNFQLHYQPQIDRRGRVVGAEALMRWKDPKRGNVPPAAFIAHAEETGFILVLGQWALQEAADQLRGWQHDESLQHLSLAVNVSAQQIRQRDFVHTVLSTLEGAGAPMHKLKLELTESTLAYDIDDLIAKMASLDDRRIEFALDDFGTGYSSLAYLKHLPIRQLKIDKSFVHDVHEHEGAAAIARTLISLGKTLNLTIVAEGVETAAQQQFLRDEGCDQFQGFLYSRALPLEEFKAFVKQRNGAVPQQ